MKKMFFTAIALLAFSATSMANTIEIKEIVIPAAEGKELNSESKKEIKVIKTDCNLVRFKAYNSARSDGWSHQDASGMSYSIYFTCLSVSSEL